MKIIDGLIDVDSLNKFQIYETNISYMLHYILQCNTTFLLGKL